MKYLSSRKMQIIVSWQNLYFLGWERERGGAIWTIMKQIHQRSGRTSVHRQHDTRKPQLNRRGQGKGIYNEDRMDGRGRLSHHFRFKLLALLGFQISKWLVFPLGWFCFSFSVLSASCRRCMGCNCPAHSAHACAFRVSSPGFDLHSSFSLQVHQRLCLE